jgi:hypothetical protein
MKVLFSIDFLEQAIHAARMEDPSYEDGLTRSSVHSVAIDLPLPLPATDSLRALLMGQLALLRQRTDNYNPRNIPWRSVTFKNRRVCDVDLDMLSDADLLAFFMLVLTNSSAAIA